MNKRNLAILIGIMCIILVGLSCAKEVRQSLNMSYRTDDFSDYKKPYECKRIDFYKGAKLDYTAKGKCVGVIEYPNDIPFDAMYGKYRKFFPNKEFPGRVSVSEKRESIDLEVEFPIHRMISTGAYAAPSEEIELEVSEEFVDYGFYLHIGVHKDNVAQIKDAMRDANVSESKKITSKITKLKNKRGGPVYIEGWMIKDGTFSGLSWEDAAKDAPVKQGKYKVSLRNVIRAPYFKLGKTTPQEWVNEIRCNPAPWAELEANQVIITVPSSVIRNLNNPEPILKYWDAGTLSINEQAGWSKTQNIHKERFVTDVNISAGYMHSGYPIMTFLDVARFVVDQEPLDPKQPWSPGNSRLGVNYILGHFHEMAHNRQASHPWISAELGEASTNIFVIKANCEVNGFDFNQTNIFNSEQLYQTLKYFNGDDSIAKKDLVNKYGNQFTGAVNNSAFANLLYMHIYTHFGFKIYRDLIVHYRQVDMATWDKGNACKNNREVECNTNKMNSYALELSRLSGKDMREYFKNWGFSLTWAEEEIKILSLEKWKPFPLFVGFDIGSTPLVENSFYDFGSLKGNGNFTLNVERNAKEDGSSIVVWNRWFAQENTQFQLAKAGSGSSVYTLLGKASGKCIGLDKEEKNLVLRNCDPSALSQQWKIEKVEIEGIPFHTLYNMSKMKYLSIVSNKPEALAKLEFVSTVDKIYGSQIWILRNKE